MKSDMPWLLTDGQSFLPYLILILIKMILAIVYQIKLD